MAIFSERLRELRKASGLSQAELAIQLGVAMNTVSIWELGKRMPEAKTIKEIAKHFLVTEKYLLGQSDIGDLGSMIDEIKRLRGNTEDVEESCLEAQIVLMFRDLSPEAKKALYDVVKESYEGEQDHGRLKSQHNNN